MPLYEVKGYGRDTSRKRSRVYSADNEEHLYQVAGDDGTIIESWSLYEIEPEPPSAAQLAYAARLGIKLPTGALTMAQVSDLISEATGDTGRMAATREQLQTLKALGLWDGEAITREDADDKLGEFNTAMTWIYSVIRHHAKLNWTDRKQTYYLDNTIREFALELAQDAKIMGYINNVGHGMYTDAFDDQCIQFNQDASEQADQWYFFDTDDGPSTRSNAYKWVAERLKINIIQEAIVHEKPKPSVHAQKPPESPVSSLKDVLFAITVFLTVVAFFAGMASASGAGVGVQFATGLGWALFPGLLAGLLKVTSLL